MIPANLAQVLIAAHNDALKKAELGRKTNRHHEAMELELIALTLRVKMGHEPSRKLEAILVALAENPPPGA